MLRQITAAGRIDATVVRVLQGETDNIRLLDRRLGAPAVAGKLDAHIGQIETSLRYSLRPGNRQQLARALADASALAGWQAIDMNRLPRAWAHFERATAAAREAADPCLLAFAAGEQAYVLLDLHRPAEALAMVRAAYEETRDRHPAPGPQLATRRRSRDGRSGGGGVGLPPRPRRRRPGDQLRCRQRGPAVSRAERDATWPAGAATA